MVLYHAVTDASVPAGWAAGELRAAFLDRQAGTVTPVAFAERRLAAGETITIPADRPTLLRRALPSPYAPGNFTFAKDRTLHEAEGDAVERAGASVATRLRGYSGPGYVAVETGAAVLGWTVETGAAGRRKATLRYQLADRQSRTGELVLVDDSNIAIARLPVTLTGSADWQELALATPGLVNAGRYRVELRLESGAETAIDFLRFE